MISLLIEGGPVFTFPMTFIFLINLVLIARAVAFAFGDKYASQEAALRQIEPIRNIGVFLVATGILGQLIGLYSAFEAIQEWGSIEPGMLAGGLRVSSIATLLGLAYFVISYAAWILIRIKVVKD